MWPTPPAVYHPYQHGPLLLGSYSISAGLYRLGQQVIHHANNQVERHTLAFDMLYPQYLARKVAARRSLAQHYVQAALPIALRTAALGHLAAALAQDSGGLITWDGQQLSNQVLGWRLHLDLPNNAVLDRQDFTAPLSKLSAGVELLDAFDALAMQAQEDLSIWARNKDGSEYQALIHALYPQNWQPLSKIGRSFAEVHEPVAGITAISASVPKLLSTIILRGPFVRFGWGVNLPDRLSQHPALSLATEGWHLWVERQTLTGFAEQGGALFSMRPYAYPLAQILDAPHTAALLDALRSMTPQQAEYKGMGSSREELLTYLESLV